LRFFNVEPARLAEHRDLVVDAVVGVDAVVMRIAISGHDVAPAQLDDTVRFAEACGEHPVHRPPIPRHEPRAVEPEGIAPMHGLRARVAGRQHEAKDGKDEAPHAFDRIIRAPTPATTPQ